MGNDKTEIMGNPIAAATFASDETNCPSCSAELIEGVEFCGKCGYQRGTWQAAPEASVDGGTDRVQRFKLTDADGRNWPVFEGENEIGRGEVAIQIDNPYASRSHAMLTVSEDGQAELTDLGSSNGTIVDGDALAANTAHSIGDGGSFEIGGATFTLSAVEVAEDVAEAESADPAGDETMVAASEANEEAVDDDSGEQPVADVGVADQAAGAELSPWVLTEASGTAHALVLGQTLLGRKEHEGGIQITGDGYVSGKHCVFVASADSLSVEDLGSTNGTKVAGEPVAAGDVIPLEDSAVVTVGQTELSVSLVAETEADAAAPADDESDNPDENGEQGQAD